MFAIVPSLVRACCDTIGRLAPASKPASALALACRRAPGRDTHILLWLRITPKRLSAPESRALDSARLRYISAATEDVPLLTRDEAIIAYGTDGARIVSAAE